MENKIKARKIVYLLKEKYGKEIPTYLNYHKNKPYEFLFAVMLSAMCTDKRVNIVTKRLFKKYDSLKKFANANIEEFENDIYEVGFYKNKAKNIIETANILINEYNSQVPNNISDLLNLKGVGRKTANVILPKLYNVDALAVDTHVNRISNKVFTLNTKNPLEVEKKLLKILDNKDLQLWNTHIIALGREICKARKPLCEKCFLKELCNDYINNKKS